MKQIKFESSHSLVTLVNENSITKNGFIGVRLDYVPQRADIGSPTTYIIINNGKYSYRLTSKTASTEEYFSMFKFLNQNENYMIWEKYTTDDFSFDYPPV